KSLLAGVILFGKNSSATLKCRVARVRSVRARKLRAGLIVGGGVGLLAAVCAYLRPAPLERAEFWTYDVRARQAAHPEAASRDIVFVDVGETDLQSVEQNLDLSWPWPRALFAALTEQASQGGARAVILDWIFQDQGCRGADDNDELAAALRK